MSQLKEENGKYYQEVEVVMLAAEKECQIYSRPTTTAPEYLGFLNTPQVANTINSECKGYHLYFLSDDEIKEGDGYYTTQGNRVVKCTKEEMEILITTPEIKKHFLKVIATTDESLTYTSPVNPFIENVRLPKPSDSFIKKYIEEYNAGRQITKVLVEHDVREYRGRIATPLKVDSNNTVTIKKVKDSYSREEVAKMLHVVGTLSYEYGLYVMKKGGVSRGDFTITDWIDKNL